MTPDPTCTGSSEVSAERVRTLLGKLRDLNLTGARIALAGGRSLVVQGCASLDLPVEEGVRYRIATEGAGETTLGVCARDGALELSLFGTAPPRLAELAVDPEGRLQAAALGARIHPESAQERAVEHFLRRLVRGAFAATDAGSAATSSP